jgi:hypothetical protein
MTLLAPVLSACAGDTSGVERIEVSEVANQDPSFRVQVNSKDVRVNPKTWTYLSGVAVAISEFGTTAHWAGAERGNVLDIASGYQFNVPLGSTLWLDLAERGTTGFLVKGEVSDQAGESGWKSLGPGTGVLITGKVAHTSDGWVIDGSSFDSVVQACPTAGAKSPSIKTCRRRCSALS